MHGSADLSLKMENHCYIMQSINLGETVDCCASFFSENKSTRRQPQI